MLSTIIICALFAYGMFTVQRPGFLLDGWRKLWKKFPKGLHEPLFECGVCVASIWGGFAFLWMLYVVPVHPLLALPVVLVSASGIGAFMDRAVKAFEKTYGYKPPSPPDKKWEYLKPYEELRWVLFDLFNRETWMRGGTVVEVGGTHFIHNLFPSGYVSFNKVGGITTLNEMSYKDFTFTPAYRNYDVVILGLAFEGDIRVLRKLIEKSKRTIIEYSDDGISRHQVDLLTEGISTKLVIPEFEINVDCKTSPAGCGDVTKRKIIIIEPCH